MEQSILVNLETTRRMDKAHQINRGIEKSNLLIVKEEFWQVHWFIWQVTNIFWRVLHGLLKETNKRKNGDLFQFRYTFKTSKSWGKERKGLKKRFRKIKLHKMLGFFDSDRTWCAPSWSCSSYNFWKEEIFMKFKDKYIDSNGNRIAGAGAIGFLVWLAGYTVWLSYQIVMAGLRFTVRILSFGLIGGKRKK